MDKENKLIIGRVSAEYKERYEVIASSHQYISRITGKILHNAKLREDYPAIGDYVKISPIDDTSALIQEILPRKSVLRKKYGDKLESQLIATNVDVAFIVESVGRDYNLNRFERFVVLAKDGKIIPVIVLNKIDLITQTDLNKKLKDINSRFGEIDVITTSTITKQGLFELKNYIQKDKTYCFLGSSGVGKSSLINALLGSNQIKTSEIGSQTQRGKHTTTNREMHFLENGGVLIDNPGIREIGMVSSENGIDDVFKEIIGLSKDCKFTDCTHTNEPKCAVLEAVEAGTLSEDQYQNYLKLKKEADFYEMAEIEKRNKDRKFGKFIKKALEQLEKN